MTNTFWTIWPHYPTWWQRLWAKQDRLGVFDTDSRASMEARDLAQKNPGARFYVMRSECVWCAEVEVKAVKQEAVYNPK